MNIHFASRIYIYTLLACLLVCLHPINIKTAEPIGPKFGEGPHMTPGKECLKSKNIVLKSLLFFFIENARKNIMNFLYTAHR